MLFIFFRASDEASDRYDTQRFARASILNSTLTLESAANICLQHLGFSKQFINDIEKTTSFAKLDLFAQIHSGKSIDRGNVKYQKVAELKRIRDSFVHPKKFKVPIEFFVNEEKYLDLTEVKIEIEANPYTATKIDKSSMLWFANDAREALESVLGFYDYYFINLLELDSKEILGLLGNSIFFKKDDFFLFHPESLEVDFTYLSSIGINQDFIHLASIPKMKSENL